MKALISPNEPFGTGYRVADIHPIGFDVAQPLFWVDCDDNVLADQFWYDPADQTIKPMPEPEQTEE
jgi:hypothetical protein